MGTFLRNWGYVGLGTSAIIAGTIALHALASLFPSNILRTRIIDRGVDKPIAQVVYRYDGLIETLVEDQSKPKDYNFIPKNQYLHSITNVDVFRSERADLEKIELEAEKAQIARKLRGN